MDDLLESLTKGDDAATEQVFHRCEPLLRMIIRRQLSRKMRTQFDSEDIVQSVWADLVVGFRAGRWKFESSAELRAFLVRAAKNRLIDRMRQANASSSNRRFASDQIGELPALSGPTPSEFAQANDAWTNLLALCPPAHRAIVEMKRDGKSIREIADANQLHPSSVRRILYELARRLGDKEGNSVQ
ncbi:MAG: sigma-70 family RNA polymerase sigma factor [Planctomycetota bacterium]